eukprot:1105690-Prymnesium_polylepis.2
MGPAGCVLPVCTCMIRCVPAHGTVRADRRDRGEGICETTGVKRRRRRGNDGGTGREVTDWVLGRAPPVKQI